MDATSTAAPSLRALLAGTVDYAGLFPPAGLPLKEALVNHASYLSTGEAWMLGAFVLPTARMAEAGPTVSAHFSADHLLLVSALLGKTETPEAFLANLAAGLRDLARFREQHDIALSVVVDQLEAPLPLPLPVGDELRVLLKQAAGLIDAHQRERTDAHALNTLAAFWEVPLSDNLPAIIAEVVAFNAGAAHPFALKLRTGGLTAAAFPTTGQLAGVLVAARHHGVALKFTAGLHHPIRRFDEGVQTHMHGFLNVFAAGILAREHGLGVADTETILKDENPAGFRFVDDDFCWRDLKVSSDAIAAHREFITSFGSCSFDEPCDDLRQLGLLA